MAGGLAQLAPRGLLFELQIFTSQMPAGAALARAFPATTFVLEHAGMPEDLSDQGRAAWRAGMRELAACPNMFVKLSALGTFVHRATLADIQPIVSDTVTLFGAGRCLWGSNFPIEKIGPITRRWWRISAPPSPICRQASSGKSCRRRRRGFTVCGKLAYGDRL